MPPRARLRPAAGRGDPAGACPTPPRGSRGAQGPAEAYREGTGGLRASARLIGTKETGRSRRAHLWAASSASVTASASRTSSSAGSSGPGRRTPRAYGSSCEASEIVERVAGERQHAEHGEDRQGQDQRRPAASSAHVDMGVRAGPAEPSTRLALLDSQAHGERSEARPTLSACESRPPASQVPAGCPAMLELEASLIRASV